MLTEGKKWFLITCEGFCATKWLSTALTMHPEIYCSHNIGPIDKFDEEYSEDDVIENSAGQDRMSNTPIFEAITQITPDTDKKYIGNIHGYTARALFQNVKNNPTDIQNFKAINLVRHPVSWVASAYANWQSQTQFSPFARSFVLMNYVSKFPIDGHKDAYYFYKHVAEKYSLDPLDWSFLSFVTACNGLVFLLNDLEIAQNLSLQHLKMEEITTDRTMMCAVIKALTSPDISIEDEYLDRVYNIGAKNKHSRKKATPEERFSSWNEWQKEIFVKLANNRGFLQSYKNIGYDIDFVPK